MSNTVQSSSDKSTSVCIKKSANPLQAFQNEMNKLFHDFFGEQLPHWWRSSESYGTPFYSLFSFSPATDVVETDKDIRITAEMPGLDAKDIAVTINDHSLTIKGEKKAETKEEKDGYFRQERSYGEFHRVIALPPHTADTDKAEAHVNKGILTITVPKKADAQSKPRRLDIKQAA